MKTILGLVACFALVLGGSADVLARPGGGGGGFGASAPFVSAPHATVSPQASGPTYTINSGQTVGPQVVGAPYTAVVNNGTINGGSSTALTTVPTVTDVTNNGTITSSTQGVSMTGSPSLTLSNNGVITITNSSTGTNTATSQATGITQQSGP